jgi:hypothetical protein
VEGSDLCLPQWETGVILCMYVYGTGMHPDVVDEASSSAELLGAVLAMVRRLARVDLLVLEQRAVAPAVQNFYFICHLMWCPGQNKIIVPLSFFHGCR